MRPFFSTTYIWLFSIPYMSSSNLGSWPVPTIQSLSTTYGGIISVYPLSLVCLSRRNWISERCNLAPAPLKTAKPLPAILEAASKSIRLSLSTIWTWFSVPSSWGLLFPHSLITGLESSSYPTGQFSWGIFGIDSKRLFCVLSASSTSSDRFFNLTPISRTVNSISEVSSPFFFLSPISFDFAFLSLWIDCFSVSIWRRFSSQPRRESIRSKASPPRLLSRLWCFPVLGECAWYLAWGLIIGSWFVIFKITD